MMPSDDDLNRQIGETMVELRYIREQVDRMAADMDKVKLELAEIRGSRKTAEWVRSIVAGLIGAVTGIISLLGVFGGFK